MSRVLLCSNMGNHRSSATRTPHPTTHPSIHPFLSMVSAFYPHDPSIFHPHFSVWRFPKRGVLPKSSILVGLNRVFHSKPSNRGYPHLELPSFRSRPRHDFRRHPAMAELADPSGRFIVALEKDLKEEMPGAPCD